MGQWVDEGILQRREQQLRDKLPHDVDAFCMPDQQDRVFFGPFTCRYTRQAGWPHLLDGNQQKDRDCASCNPSGFLMLHTWQQDNGVQSLSLGHSVLSPLSALISFTWDSRRHPNSLKLKDIKRNFAN